MAKSQGFGLIDDQGQPLDTGLERALGGLIARFRHQFPELDDDVTETELLEAAGQRVAKQTQGGSRIRSLGAYAWVVLRRLGQARLRHSEARVRAASVSLDNVAERGVAATDTLSAEAVERRILCQELLALLSEDERDILLQKLHGLSMAEIAANCGRTEGAVRTAYYRIRMKLRDTAKREPPVSPKAGAGGVAKPHVPEYSASASATRLRRRRTPAV